MQLGEPYSLARDNYNNLYITNFKSGAGIAVLGLSNPVLTDQWDYGDVTTGNTGVIGTLSVSTTADIVGATTLNNTLSVSGASNINNTLDVAGVITWKAQRLIQHYQYLM